MKAEKKRRSRPGRKRWSGWSGSCLDISSDGDYILSSKGPVVRLISSAGTLLWEKSMDISVTDVSMSPDASVIAVTGGGRVRIVDFRGEDIASNASMSINHLKVLPSGDRILITTTRNVQLSNLTLLAEWSDPSSTQDLVALAEADQVADDLEPRARSAARQAGLRRHLVRCKSP